MRKDIVHPGAKELSYEIREIVNVAKQLEKLGLEITWENIGDPVQKGEKIPEWIKEKVAEIIKKDRSWGYCPTKGFDLTREFLAQLTNKRNKAQITKEDIIFFNGLGDAVAKVYGFLKKEARVIGPSPAYPTHSSAEGAHAGDDPITYELDPNNNWLPDLQDLRNKVKYNDSIVGILIINPDNPTGMVYPEETMKGIVKIAKEFNLFIITDEIYLNITYNGTKGIPLSDVIEDVPGIAMKGISKELPWPGSRCGWIEFYNTDKNQIFKTYAKSIIDAKMLEVCSTSLPQLAIPAIFSDPRYKERTEKRNKEFERRANQAYEILKNTKGITVNKTYGAFYMTVLFNELNGNHELEIKNKEIKNKIQELTQNQQPDKRFVYYLLGSTGICVVPISSFCCNRNGFRITLLETDDEKREWIFKTVKQKIEEYLKITSS